MWPNDWELWKLMSKFLLKVSLPSLAIYCATVAITICDSPVLDVGQLSEFILFIFVVKKCSLTLIIKMSTPDSSIYSSMLPVLWFGKRCHKCGEKVNSFLSR